MVRLRELAKMNLHRYLLPMIFRPSKRLPSNTSAGFGHAPPDPDYKEGDQSTKEKGEPPACIAANSPPILAPATILRKKVL